MTAVPVVPSEHAVRDAIERLSRVEPGPFQVLSCYLKLEPRDKERGKYLIKMKNRVKRVESDLARRALDHAQREEVAADLARGGKFHGSGQAIARAGVHVGSAGEHNYHMRMRAEKQRLYAQVADRVFQIHTQRPLAGLVAAGIGVDGAALLPHLHSYLHDLVLGVVRLNPKRVTPAEVREAALLLREERERAWERTHAEAVREGLGSGWAVNGVEPSLKALQRGQVRTLLADGQDDDRSIDDAVEDAFAQRVQVDVVYDERARKVVDGLAGLLRFRR